tara:strand:- start:68 stop:877 length:810 start_codon:yes stop_codon:yes gene_type:complete
MQPLLEMMMQAQNGEAARAMAKQFGLKEDQISQAMEALMPAFSTGLKRNATNPEDIGNFMQALANGNHADYFNNVSQAFSPQGVAEGNGILGHLFGSKEVSRAVAQQAEQATGIGQNILKQLLPVIASTIMGGLANQATGGSKSSGASGNVFADMLGQMMGQAGAGQKQAAANAPENPLGQMMETMFGGAAGKDGKTSGNPFADMIGNMMKGGMAGMGQTAAPEPEKQANPLDNIFGDMFEAGTKVQKDYQKNVDSIFDSYLKGMNKQR